MQHRDKVLLEKIISEIDIAARIMGTKGQAEFLEDEILKRAIGMTVINIMTAARMPPYLPTGSRIVPQVASA